MKSYNQQQKVFCKKTDGCKSPKSPTTYPYDISITNHGTTCIMLSQKVIMLPPLPGLRGRKLSSTWEWLKFHPTTRRCHMLPRHGPNLCPMTTFCESSKPGKVVADIWEDMENLAIFVENEPFTGEK
jgi:hypothetical protein